MICPCGLAVSPPLLSFVVRLPTTHQVTWPHHPASYYSARSAELPPIVSLQPSFRLLTIPLLLQFSGPDCSRKLAASITAAVPTPSEDHMGMLALDSLCTWRIHDSMSACTDGSYTYRQHSQLSHDESA